LIATKREQSQESSSCPLAADELDLFAEDDEGAPRRGRRGRGGAGGMERTGSGVGRAPRGAAGVRPQHNIVTTFNAQTQVGSAWPWLPSCLAGRLAACLSLFWLRTFKALPTLWGLT
jgi:hypothetical protein